MKLRIMLQYYLCTSYLKGKVHQKRMLISEKSVRSDKIGKNAVDRFLISLVVLKIFAFKVKKLVIWRPPSRYANKSDMTSQLQEEISFCS